LGKAELGPPGICLTHGCCMTYQVFLSKVDSIPFSLAYVAI